MAPEEELALSPIGLAIPAYPAQGTGQSTMVKPDDLGLNEVVPAGSERKPGRKPRVRDVTNDGRTAEALADGIVHQGKWCVAVRGGYEQSAVRS